MHSALCQVCDGAGLQLAMRAGVVTRRDPARTVSTAIPRRCPSCRGRRVLPVPGRTLAGRRLPAL